MNADGKNIQTFHSPCRESKYERFVRRSSIAITLSATLVASSSALGVPLLSEDFESGVLNPLLSVQTVGNFIASHGINDITNFGSTKAFWFGMSDCPANCLSAHQTNLDITFNQPTFVSTIAFDEMELYGNWGSEGSIFLDNSNTALSTFGRIPVNDLIPDTTFRSHLVNVDTTVTKITFNVWDITNQSEIFLDNLVVSEGSPTSVPEPSTFVLMSLGLAGMSWVRRRRLA